MHGTIKGKEYNISIAEGPLLKKEVRISTRLIARPKKKAKVNRALSLDKIEVEKPLKESYQ